MTKIPTIKDFRPFVICTPENYKQTRKFFIDLGFKILWEGDDVAEFSTGFGDQRFMLTLHIMEKPANPGVLHFWVDDVDKWHEYVNGLKLDEKDYQFNMAGPNLEPWGWRILYLWAPSGLLMHFAEPHAEENKQFFNNADWMQK